MATKAFQKIYTKVTQITKATCSLKASGVGNEELATVNGKLAQVVKIMVLTALPGSQGLFGFLGYFLLKPFLVEHISMFQGVAICFIGIAVGAVELLTSIRQGQVCANGASAMGNGHDVFNNTLILAVFPELYSIIAVAAAFLVSTSLGTPIA